MAGCPAHQRQHHRVLRLGGRVPSWNSGVIVRVALGLFGTALLYGLTQTIFKVPIEAYENNAYRRVAKGLRNPRRIREARLRIPFLTLSCLLFCPILFAYLKFRLHTALLSYSLIVLTTTVLYLLACDPLPPGDSDAELTHSRHTWRVLGHRPADP